MAKITASDVNTLRQQTGAGMMDCKNALVEANGDFAKAIDVLRKKGQKIALNRENKEANEGCVLAKINHDGKNGVLLAVNCETDFVAKNVEFIHFANTLADLAAAKCPKTKEELKALALNGRSVEESISDMILKIGEKIELSFYETVHSPKVVAYNHPGNRLATLVGLNNNTVGDIDRIGKEIAMQVAAMNPIAIDKDNVDKAIIDKEIEIGKEQAKREGKPENILEKIALGKLSKFYKENTLLNQDYVKDHKKTIRQLLSETERDLKVTSFKRFALA